MLELFISAFVTLFVVIDPPGCAPIYAGLTSGASNRQSRVMALRACIIATIILVGFALFGEALLGALHIELNSFRIAGGIMLFIIALEMVLAKRTDRADGGSDEAKPAAEVEDVSTFPMAMPIIAGPGSIATIMLLMARAEGTQATFAILAALAAVMVLTFAALAAAGPLMRLMGARVEAVITRLLGVLLAALAAQYVIDGVRRILA
jgi:multiple antibiotic resistance protein